jgi:hypothetical protein
MYKISGEAIPLFLIILFLSFSRKVEELKGASWGIQRYGRL